MEDKARQALDRKVRVRRFWRAAFLDEFGVLTTEGALALKALGDFCHAYKTTAKFSPVMGTLDTAAMSFAEGRREVFLFIDEMLKVNDAEFGEKINMLYQLNEGNQEND